MPPLRRRSGKVWIADARPGHPAVLGFRGKFHDASVCPSVMVRLVAVLVQVLLSSEHAVENGFCFVMDAEGIGWNNFSLDAERIYMSLFTSLPVRLTRESAPARKAQRCALRPWACDCAEPSLAASRPSLARRHRHPQSQPAHACHDEPHVAVYRHQDEGANGAEDLGAARGGAAPGPAPRVPGGGHSVLTGGSLGADQGLVPSLGDGGAACRPCRGALRGCGLGLSRSVVRGVRVTCGCADGPQFRLAWCGCVAQHAQRRSWTVSPISRSVNASAGHRKSASPVATTCHAQPVKLAPNTGDLQPNRRTNHASPPAHEHPVEGKKRLVAGGRLSLGVATARRVRESLAAPPE